MDLNLDDHEPYLVNRVGSRLEAAFTQETGTEINNWRVLAVLQREDGVRVGELAAATSIERSTLSRVLKRMEGLRLIRRHRSGSDARTVTVHLTNPGRARAKKLTPVALELGALAVRGFSKQEAKIFKELLLRAYENLGALDAPLAERK